MNHKNIKTSSDEAHAYTPGLKIKRLETVRRERVLPIEGKVHVNVGDRVDFDTIVASAEIPGEPTMVNIAETLGVDPVDITKYLEKRVGENVVKGEVVAKDVAFFGLVKKFVESPITGYIESVSDVTGQVILREPNVPVRVASYIPGRVMNILPSKGAVIEADAALLQGIFGIGGESHGEISMAASSPRERITEDQISPDHVGKIVVVGSLLTHEIYVKAVEAGAKGLIAGGIDVEAMIGIVGEDIGVAITGEEEVGAPVVITEGFGELPISNRAFELLSSLDGRLASINGTTQIRAGVIRPEIIIPYEGSAGSRRPAEDLSKGMSLGTLVRIIREPYFGVIASVVDLPVNLLKIETESEVRVVEVELEDGKRVTIPRANVEVIEE